MTVSSQNKPKLRLFRFRLRTLLLAMLVFCVLFGSKVEEARRQRRAVEWVHKHGGTVKYEHEKTDATGYPLPSPPPGPKWLLEIAGIDFLDSVVSVDLSGAQVSNLWPLADLPQLKTLWLCDVPVTDLAPLAKLRRLQTLQLTQCDRVADLAPLAELTELRTLHIDNMPLVTDLAPLAGLKKLRALYAHNTPISGLSPLAELSDLRHIDLLDSGATDLSPLSGLENLRTLRFRGGQISDLTPLEGLNKVQITTWHGGDVKTPKSLMARVVWQ
jgi:Leucine-rich repeat (LRR) protein